MDTHLRRSPIFQRWGRSAIRAGKKTQTRRIAKLSDPTGTYACRDDDSWPMTADDLGDYSRDHPRHGRPGDVWGLREPLVRGYADIVQYADDDENVYRETSTGASTLEAWQWKRDTLTSLFMPLWAARTFRTITDVRVERVQDISGADAIAEGCDANLFAALLDNLVGKAEPLAPYWSRDGDWMGCFECGVKRFGEEALDGGWCGEQDGPRWCEDCGKLLDFTLTDAGIHAELEGNIEAINTRVTTPDEAYITHRMLQAGGWPRTGESSHDADLKGPIARLCFREVWDSINLARGHGWDANDWVFAYTVRPAMAAEVEAAI